MESYKFCEICGKRLATDEHHLIFGIANRRICDKTDCTKMKICRECHNSIHNNPTASALSKMLGQALWENEMKGLNSADERARTMFMETFGRSFL